MKWSADFLLNVVFVCHWNMSSKRVNFLFSMFNKTLHFDIIPKEKSICFKEFMIFLFFCSFHSVSFLQFRASMLSATSKLATFHMRIPFHLLFSHCQLIWNMVVSIIFHRQSNHSMKFYGLKPMVIILVESLPVSGWNRAFVKCFAVFLC